VNGPSVVTPSESRRRESARSHPSAALWR
jgi:hypothetical protein